MKPDLLAPETLAWLDDRFRHRFPTPPSGDLTQALKFWQMGQLVDLLQWVTRRSPWYGRHFNQAQVADLVARLRGQVATGSLGGRSAASFLAELPLTGASDLASASELFLAVGQDDIEGIVSVPTSGTTGPVKRIFSTAEDLHETVTFFEYGMRFMVAPGGDRVALAMSPARAGNVGDLLGQAMARWGIPFLAHGFVPEEAESEAVWLRALVAWRPTCLVGVPGQVLAVSRHDLAPDLAENLKVILLSGDTAEDSLVVELEQCFPKAKVFRHYGLTEAGLGGAVECPRRQGLHLRDDLLVEIIGPDDQPVEGQGQVGEIVITPLTRRGLPLIRYRTGDEGLIEPGACLCGSVMPRLRVFGRGADCFVLPKGRVVRVGDFESPLAALPFVRNYEMRSHLNEPGFLVFILSVTPETPVEAPRLAAEALWQWLGPDGQGLSLAVEIIRPGEETPTGRPPTGGKRRLLKLEGRPDYKFIFRS